MTAIGTRVPRLDGRLAPSGRVVKRRRFPPRARLRLPGLDLVREGLVRAAREGTSASVFRDFPVPVAGKTGTAEAPPGSDHSWYASWAPASKPFGLEPIAPPRGSLWRPAGVALAGAALLGLLVLAFRPSGGDEPQLPATFRPPAAASAEHAAAAPASTPVPLPEVALVAARGRCWLLVRSGSERGRVLYEGTLERGEEVRFRSRRLWIRLGAPWNVDLLVDGRPRPELGTLLAGGRPRNVLVTRAGVREA